MDPFVGTGSLILTCSWFGAYTWGSDIDGRTFSSEDKTINIQSNFEYHKIGHLLVDLIISDNAIPCWKKEIIFDAIIADRNLKKKTYFLLHKSTF